MHQDLAVGGFFNKIYQSIKEETSKQKWIVICDILLVSHEITAYYWL